MDSRLRKAAQNWNSAGVASFFRVIGPDRRLVLPHLSVPDIRWVDWGALRDAGFLGCVFDKDNTLTEPFSLEVRHELRPALEECIATFRPLGGVALLSNSAGLQQYDPEGHEAEALERALGMKVIRHARKKPDGTAEELEHHFGCPPSQLVMIGDRYMTDVLYGNRLGLLTVYTQPLTGHGEPMGVRIARGLENSLVAGGRKGGTDAPPHPLMQRALEKRLGELSKQQQQQQQQEGPSQPSPPSVGTGGAVPVPLGDANATAKFLGWVRGKGCW